MLFNRLAKALMLPVSWMRLLSLIALSLFLLMLVLIISFVQIFI